MAEEKQIWWCVDHDSQMVTASFCHAVFIDYFGRSESIPSCIRKRATLKVEE